ncbi:MAG TPA: ABC transporter ATP-binding protein [Gemmatimonadaceae bacterium]
MAGERYSDVSLFRRLAGQARPFWPHIAALLLVSLLSSPLVLLAPLPLKIAVDSGIGSHPLPRVLEPLLPAAPGGSSTAVLALAAALVLLIALASQLQELASKWLRTYTGEKLVLGFRARLFHHVQRLSLAYHDARGTSDSLYRIQSDAAAIQYIAIDGVIPFLTAGGTLAGMIYVMAHIDWQLAAVALAVSPVHFVVARVYRRRLRARSREVKQLESTALSLVQETLGALRVVKAFGREDHHERHFVRRSGEGVRARLDLTCIEGSLGLVTRLTTAAGTAATLVIGALHVRSGTLTLGELLLVMGYLAQLYAPVTTMGKTVATLQSHLASAERAFALLDEAPDVTERPNARPLARAAGAVAFRDVSFAYVHGRAVLHDVSFAVGPGTLVGVAGATGAGKTTLVSLLTRFYDPTKGRILLDGVDLRDCRVADLRNQFAFVLQEPVLFSASVSENIAYARPDASQEEIVRAAKAADAHEFIVTLPRGYDTLVGERGMRLSGGERQRVSLARAFLKDAPILILDEPTSSVDAETEGAILEAMMQLARGRTTFMISHRLPTLGRCDVLLHLAHGRLVHATFPSPAPAGNALAEAVGEERR